MYPTPRLLIWLVLPMLGCGILEKAEQDDEDDEDEWDDEE